MCFFIQNHLKHLIFTVVYFNIILLCFVCLKKKESKYSQLNKKSVFKLNFLALIWIIICPCFPLCTGGSSLRRMWRKVERDGPNLMLPPCPCIHCLSYAPVFTMAQFFWTWMHNSSIKLLVNIEHI